MDDHSILNLSPQEKAAYSYLFGLADSDSLNVVTGERAVTFFEKTHVPANVLGEAWQIADTENRGLLTKPGFCMVLRLIGWYQNGQQQPTTELAFKQAPIPKFDGITLPAAAASPTTSAFPQGALQPQLSGQSAGSAPIRVPPLDPAKVQQYSGLFGRSGAQNGLLDGGTAKSIFERAGLTNETLGKIWMLSDREQRGALDETEFIVAMHLLTSMKTRSMPALPNVLPQGLYDAAARRGQRPPSRQGSGQAPGQARQLVGSTIPRTQSPLARPPSSSYTTPSTQSAQPTGTQWLVSPQEKAQYDRHFSNIDTSGQGVLSGEQAVTFFSDSRLPEETLATIWDLADINSEGQLNREEFAVAMYLIRQQRSPNPPPLPAFLPSALVPPSMRGGQQQQFQSSPAQFQQQSAFDSTPTPMQPKASDDLFGLDSSPTQTQTAQPQQFLQQQGTGASATRDPFAGSAQSSPSAPNRFQPQQPTQTGSSTFKPFVPSSAFGASLAAQNTGSSTTSQPRGPKAPMPSAMDDLLGDNEANAEESRNITNESTELANMSNQIGNLRSQMETTQSRKTATQADLTASNNQKRDLEQRLQQFRAQYEAEVRTVKEMEQQLSTSRASTKQLSQDLAMLEGTQQDLQTQHNTISQQLQSDQQENATLKQRISQINAEVTRLKPEIEKMKLDARQQRGMVSINKKQLATNEAERDRLASEKAGLEREASEAQARSLTSSPEPAIRSNVASPTVTSNVASPAASAAQSTNPFFRSTSPPTSELPASAGPNPSAFDAIFGPSSHFAPGGQTSSRSGTPPATSFIGRSVPDAGTASAVGAGARTAGAAAGGATALASSQSSPAEATPVTTPPASEAAKESPLTSSEPPPPPESRQFTPTNLPIGGGVVGESGGAESDTASSTKVVPPASRAGGIETPREAFSSPPSEAGVRSPEPEPQVDVIPGAFPVEERRPSITAQEVVPSNGPSTRDITPQPKPADDFESAFASFGEGEKAKDASRSEDPFAPSTSTQQSAAGSSEFPPIQTLEADDDSDSDSDDEADGGFDDNFTASSPPRNGAPGIAKALASAPEREATTPLPSYEQSTGPAVEAAATARAPSNNFPQEFGALLPAREDPTSPPPPPENEAIAGPPDVAAPAVASPTDTSSPFQTVESSSDYVDAASRPLSSIPDFTPGTQTAPTPSTTSPPKNIFDEFDDFADLSESRDAGATNNDIDFAFGRQSQDEFNPAFDSPATSQTPTPMKTSVAPVPAEAAPQQQQDVSNGFTNFLPNENEQPTTSPFGGGTGSVQRTPQDVQHDWDAIFSGLDSNKDIDTSLSQSNANAEEIWQPPPGPPPGRAPITANGGDAGRPTLARAISQGTEHDDPILKRLTGMGYPRGEALSALEKYDYDINKAVDHLAGS